MTISPMRTLIQKLLMMAVQAILCGQQLPSKVSQIHSNATTVEESSHCKWLYCVVACNLVSIALHVQLGVMILPALFCGYFQKNSRIASHIKKFNVS